MSHRTSTLFPYTTLFRSNPGPKPDGSPADTRSASEFFRPLWAGALIAAGGYDPALAEGAVREGHADAIAFGRPFISNPDLVDRIAAGADQIGRASCRERVCQYV